MESKEQRQVFVYYISRDSNCNGTLASSVNVWYRKPIRLKLKFENGHAWIPSAAPDADAITRDLGLYGSYTLDAAIRLFKTIPDDDLQLIRAEQYRTKSVS